MRWRGVLPGWSNTRRRWRVSRSGRPARAAPGSRAVILLLHVFENHCPHRRAPLSQGKVEGKELVCSYHGWSYGLDGALTGVPKLKERYQGRLDREKWGLIPARVSVFYGSIWATFDDTQPSFEDYLGAKCTHRCQPSKDDPGHPWMLTGGACMCAFWTFATRKSEKSRLTADVL